MSTPSIARTGVLFVCLGNICRSPLARCIFEHQARSGGLIDRFDVDSCGTEGWHVGGGANPRSVEVAARNGLALEHVARRIDPDADFDRFHYLLAMDRDNRDWMLDAGAPRERVRLMRAFDPELAGEPEHRLDVPDPYTGGPEGFDRVFAMLWSASAGLLAHVRAG